MAFSVKVLNEPVEEVYGEPCRWGQININGSSERFQMPLTVWDINQYKQQWNQAIQRIVNGADKDYLVIGLRDPWISDFISLFVLYRKGNEVFIQNQIILCEGNEEQIENMDLLDLVEERASHTEDGVEISEWKVSIGDLGRNDDDQ